MLADRFGFTDAHGSKGRFLLDFERDLVARHEAGGLTALVIDEAQSLTHELFERSGCSRTSRPLPRSSSTWSSWASRNWPPA